MNNKKRMTTKQKWMIQCLNGVGKCKICDERVLYFCKYDADFCPRCNIWITHNCKDPLCTFCSSRPQTPEHALAECNVTLDYERDYYNKQKEKAMRHFVSNEKHRKNQNKHQLEKQ